MRLIQVSVYLVEGLDKCAPSASKWCEVPAIFAPEEVRISMIAPATAPTRCFDHAIGVDHDVN